ncbi:MAG: MarR family winged helix-turn-helix transcriptional regulator [Fusobacteriaceae bacterium]|nr:MarR family winged helix-turn-helix transcriptional regulator [Fusobacteriaceae bacterium]
MNEIKKLNNQILRKIGTLSRSIHSVSDIKYRELSLQKGQFVFLTRVCENQGINFVELSRILAVDKSTTTKAVKKLIEAKYIEKKQDEKDKREYKLFPTEKALEIYDFIIDEENRSIDICVEGLSKTERKIVEDLLEKMSQNTAKDWQKLKSGNE